MTMILDELYLLNILAWVIVKKQKIKMRKKICDKTNKNWRP